MTAIDQSGDRVVSAACHLQGLEDLKTKEMHAQFVVRCKSSSPMKTWSIEKKKHAAIVFPFTNPLDTLFSVSESVKHLAHLRDQAESQLALTESGTFALMCCSHFSTRSCRKAKVPNFLHAFNTLKSRRPSSNRLE